MALLINGNFQFDGYRSSMRLEQEFWDGLQEMAKEKNVDVGQIIKNIGVEIGTRTSSVRVAILKFYVEKSRKSESHDQ